VSQLFQAGDEIQLVLRMPARAHGSHPYLDATRGAIAVARGPLVYCLEQQDAEAPVDDLLLDPASVTAAQTTKSPIAPNAVALAVTAGVAPTPPNDLYPVLREQPAVSSPDSEVTATFVPYFLWGNRTAQAMRVWLRQA
jgi:DUF1680 family protein